MAGVAAVGCSFLKEREDVVVDDVVHVLRTAEISITTAVTEPGAVQFNEDTVDKVLEHLMTHGIKVAGGDRLGKTIIFAKNQAHADFIYERFIANYPNLDNGNFARIITHATKYAQSLIDDLSNKDKAPHIAISVDMLDTGIDIPECINLVFFKLVRSKTKFWQMIGRGTRLCPDLFGPGDDKTAFNVLDFCQNLEYFGESFVPADKTGAPPLSEQIFKARLDLVEQFDALKTHGEENLIVLDPVVGHLSGNIDSYKDHAVRRALAPLAALAESTGAAILGIMHLNKSSSTDVLTRVSGSVAFGAAARSVLLLHSDPKAAEDSPERLLIHGKSNLGPRAVAVRLRVEGRTITTEGEEIETSGIAWLGDDPTATAAQVLRGHQEPSSMDIATDFLRENLADGPLLYSEIKALAADAGISPATLKRAAKEVGVESRKEEFGGGSFWSLPRTTLLLAHSETPA